MNESPQPLPRAFYELSAADVAPLLLGHFLLRRTNQGWCGGPIVETEAYLTDCFNAVCRPTGIAEAVLVRALEPAFEIEWMKENRPVENSRDLTNGPAKFCAAMKIDRTLDSTDLCDLSSPIIIAQNTEVEAFRTLRGPMIRTTRIGITRAADWPLRFYLDGSKSVSRRLPRVRAALHQNEKGVL